VRTAETGTQGILAVEIEGTSARARGRIVYREASGRVTERSIDGARCADLVGALALIAVVLIDPEAQADSEEAPVVAEAVPEDANAAAAGSEAATTAEAREARPEVPASEPGTRATPEAVAPREQASRQRWLFGAGVNAGIHTGVAPNRPFVFGVELHAERAPPQGFGVAFGLGVERAESQPVRTASGDAEFAWVAVRGWVCPMHWPSQGMASVAACGGFEGGNLRGRGLNTLDPQVQDSPWLAPVLFGRVELRPVDALTLSLDAGAAAPLLHTKFYFDPDIVAFQVPALAAFMGLAVRFHSE
jgi:hypothetical protein